MRLLGASAVLALALSMVGCTEEESPGQPGGATPTAPTDCLAGQLELDDGTCVSAGIQPGGCVAGELTLPDGSCQPAGIPAEQCGAGFVANDEYGCDPVLPAAPCPAGRMAVPGETECREVAPCLSEPYGEAPVDGQTQHVDGAYTGGNSDGSAAAPWTTIQVAIDAAADGGLVAIAAGSYAEDLVVQGKAVRLWGRCPDQVELVGLADDGSAVLVGPGASGTELHALAITGAGQGLELTGSELRLDRVWIHDTAWRGVYAHGTEGATRLTVTGSLFEGLTRLGLWLHGVEATIDQSVVRDTEADAQGDYGDGIYAEYQPATATRSDVTLRRSVLVGNRKVSVFFAGADGQVEASVVRDTQLAAAGGFGRGLQVQDHEGVRSAVTIRQTVIADNRTTGIAVYGADVDIAATVVRDTSPDAADAAGHGVHVDRSPVTGQASSLVLRSSLIARSQEIGLFVEGSESLLEGLAVRDTITTSLGLAGRGINIQTSTGDQAQLTMTGCAVERSYEAGIFLSGATATIEGTAVRQTAADALFEVGIGMSVQGGVVPGSEERTQALLRYNRIETSVGIGLLLLDGDVTVAATAVTSTVSQPGDTLGDGVLIAAWHDAATAQIVGSHASQSARAGVGCFGAEVSLLATELDCNTIQLDGELYDGQPYLMEDLGGNHCGCGSTEEVCKVLSSNLEPPTSLPGQHVQ